MANEENLIPVTQRTKSEQREIAKKAGVASGKARRKKADLKNALNILLSLEVSSDKTKSVLEEMGLPATNEFALSLITMQKAFKGDMRAIEFIGKYNSNENIKDSLDKKEQKERIEALKLGNEKLRKQIGTSEADVKDDGFIKSLEGVVEETWLD